MGALLTDFLLIKPGTLHRANGGYLLALVANAMREASGRAHPVSVNMHYLSPGPAGNGVTTTRVMKAGRRFATVAGTLSQDGRDIATALGVFGALLAYTFRERGSIPPSMLNRLRISTSIFVTFSLFYGFANSGIDNAAHLGGLVAGTLMGFIAARPLEPAARAHGHARRIALADGYFDTLQLNDGALFTRFHKDCKRVENGVQTTNNPSFAVVPVARLGCEGPNQMKAFLRCGMGPCQGRLCGLTVTGLIADERRVSPAEVGYFRLRPPVKPITLAETRSNRTTHEFGDKRWTFYELQSSRGYVTIRWYGSSNGYYGTGVDIRRKAAPSTDSTPAF